MEGLRLTFQFLIDANFAMRQGHVLTWMRIYLMFKDILDSSSHYILNPFLQHSHFPHSARIE